jgi:ATP-dependent DNA helicase RecG
MFLRSLAMPVISIPGIGSAKVKTLARLGIHNVAGLLLHYPRDYEDRGVNIPLSRYMTGRVSTLAKVIARDWIGFGRTRTLKIYIQDESAKAALMCFNRPWLDNQIIQGDFYHVWGVFNSRRGEIQSSNFEIENSKSAVNFRSILPVYSLTAGLTQALLRKYVQYALKVYASKLENELPDDITVRDSLLPKSIAIKEIHFPSSSLEYEMAKKTLIFEELFYLELMVARRAVERKKNNISAYNTEISKPEGKKIPYSGIFTPLQKRLVDRLPFTLTRGQIDAAGEINSDMNTRGIPMARLLQGDVGSGKTLVSFLAALNAVERGGQAAVMAPTELLARQHAENAAALLEPLGVKIAFLTGNIKAAGRRELLKNLLDGNIDIVVGTHALFSRDVEYKNLDFVVIDEQHRFGVTQRSLIMSKGRNPALLMMSATPIPRTLALTVFGDMDVSTINDMPAGRKVINTHLARQSSEKRVYDFIRRELAAGHQAYFVYPLIESSGTVAGDIKDAVSMAQRLSKEVFPEYRVELIHSKLDEEIKRKIMDGFRRTDVKVLAATSVVEVGVDVPNATCMVIEHAERFGLSALHQLRGRVGRGKDQSYCFLVYSDELNEDGKLRLRVMLENNDGFIIAEEDLKLRGPGQFTGTEQSGFLQLGIANPVRDTEELLRARNDAFAIMENDSDLLLENNRVIARVLEEAPPFGEIKN